MAAPVSPPKHITKRHQELRQDTVVTAYARAWGFFEQNRNLVFIGLGVLVAVVLFAIGLVFYQHNQEQKAQEALAAIVPVYEAGNYQQALDGTPETMGLLAVAEEYGGTDAGNLARFYAADAAYKTGNYELAAELFRAFDKEKNLIGASALAGEADAYVALGRPADAAPLYLRAARLYDDPLSSPLYLLQAGLAFEQAGEYDRAREAFEAIREDYPDSPQAAEVDLYLARVAARQAS
ncbi:MAG: tetratricopeptide repeat protein [Bacteroidetes bacterium]|nr:MAG: tetratricopeptide repeat protein [Bacteroidota bacterium]